MNKIIDKTGQTFNGITITKELGGGKIIGKCIHCGSEKEYSKSNITSGEYCSCGCKRHNPIDRVGQTFNGITITKELGGGKIIGKCIHCGSEKEYNKGKVVNGGYYSCGCIKHNYIDRTGQTFNGIMIIKELGKDKVIGKCIHCGSEREYRKSNILNGCSVSCGCVNYRIKDRTGQTFNGIMIIKELGGNKVIGECMHCGSEREYDKNNVVNKRYNSCGCINNRFIDRTGQVFNEIEIIKELGNNEVIGRCIHCSFEKEYRKDRLTRNIVICRNCGINLANGLRRIESHTINNIKVIKYEYTGRDNQPYYNCRCNKCGEEILLSYDEIFTYQCKKG